MTPRNAATTDPQATLEQADLADELRQAEADFARGDFVEVTIEQLDRCVAAGEWPWPDASSE
jgi:hypothetical protein